MFGIRNRNAVGCAALWAFAIGCGGNTGTTSTASGGAATAGTTASATTGTSATGNTGSTSSTGGAGGAPSACTAFVLELCHQLETCTPHVFAVAFSSDDTLCQSEATRLCGPLPSRYDGTTNGLVADPAACLPAISGTCDSFLATLDHLPPPCLPPAGTKAVDQSCITSAQCSGGLSCFGNGPAECTSYCGPVGKAGRPCGTASGPEDSLCDPAHNLHCVSPHQISFASPSDFKCTTVTYLGLGSPCVRNSDQQCDSGLACQKVAGIGIGKCVAQLQEGAPCDPTTTDKDPCDARLGIYCSPTDPAAPQNGDTCQAPYAVPDGQPCGQIQDGNVKHVHFCGVYSYCDSTTNVCTRKAMLGEPCVMGGCFSPYECAGGVCAAPTLQTDPACMPVQNPFLTCGVSDGGLDKPCVAPSMLTKCCLGPPASTTVGEATDTCVVGNSAACPANSQSTLRCDGIGIGMLPCCLSFDAAGHVSSDGTNFCFGPRICRLDAPNSGCQPGNTCMAQSTIGLDWSPFLPSNVGFCSPPSCAPPLEGCATNSDCCSMSCNLAMNICR